MNTNHINNKNLKRIAIAAGTTAAALFLSAGLVACAGTDKLAVTKEDTEQMLTEYFLAQDGVELAADATAPVIQEARPTIEVSESNKAAKPSTKKSKKNKVSVDTTVAAPVEVVVEAQPVAAQAPQVETTVAPVAAPQPAVTAAPQTETTVAVAPVVEVAKPQLSNLTLDCVNRALRVMVDASATSDIRKVEAFRANDENAELRYTLSWYGPDTAHGHTYGLVRVDGQAKSVRIVATANDGSTAELRQNFSLPC